MAATVLLLMSIATSSEGRSTSWMRTNPDMQEEDRRSYNPFDGEWYTNDNSRRRNKDQHTENPADDNNATIMPTDFDKAASINTTTVDYKFIKLDGTVPHGYSGRAGRSIEEIRFNKCPPVSEFLSVSSTDYLQGVHKDVFPLLPSDYPISLASKVNMVTQETRADSVTTTDDHQVFGANPEYWMNLVPAPVFPSGNASAPYWEQLRHVTRAQLARRRGDDPSTLSRWPNLWADFTLDDIATAVKGEYPGSLQQQLIMHQLANGGMEMDRSIAQFRSVVDYIGTEVRIASLNTWAVEAVGPINFMLKWHVGMPRPEEMAWLIASGEYGVDDGVPQDLVDSLRGMNLAHSTEFTAYKNGSPMHPSWPAMHAAASICSYWIPAIANITPEQYCEALRVDYAVAYARTVAGVHYPMDNYAGLNIGLKIIQDKLPAHLASAYGYDEDMVRNKLEALAFDWETFDPYSCTIAGEPVGARLVYPQEEGKRSIKPSKGKGYYKNNSN
jgi:membrane-associated phospholipid phosphatase